MTMPETKKTRREILIEDTAAGATALAGELFKATVCESVDRRQCCNIALAGGTTPHALYRLLAETAASGELPWGKVVMYFGDERDVPHDNVESNYHMVQQALLDHVPISPDRVHPMPADVGDLDAAAGQYEQIIRQNVPAGPAGTPAFDLILLGMGADGHTASLFPGTDAVDEDDRLVTACYVPVLGRHRMTFTFPLVNASRSVILLVTGADKAEAVAKLLGPDDARRDRLPASRVSPSGNLMIVLDAAAARLVNLNPQMK